MHRVSFELTLGRDVRNRRSFLPYLEQFRHHIENQNARRDAGRKLSML
jgi:hypothetical protein